MDGGEGELDGAEAEFGGEGGVGEEGFEGGSGEGGQAGGGLGAVAGEGGVGGLELGVVGEPVVEGGAVDAGGGGGQGQGSAGGELGEGVALAGERSGAILRNKAKCDGDVGKCRVGVATGGASFRL